MSGIDTLHGTTTDTPDVDIGALSIFDGTPETDAVCSCWAGSLLFGEVFIFGVAGPSFIDRPVRNRKAGRDVETVWMTERYWLARLRT